MFNTIAVHDNVEGWKWLYLIGEEGNPQKMTQASKAQEDNRKESEEASLGYPFLLCDPFLLK